MATKPDSTSNNQLHSRYAIYDSDLSCSDSDSEIDTEEWVSISSSTTTTTISSLPQHLNLSVKPKVELISKQALTREKPAGVLKSSLPKLSTIYVVDPNRLPNRDGSNQSPMELFHTNEYARICARCAKPLMVVQCDGTWKMVGGGICSLHMNFMRLTRSKPTDGEATKHGIVDQIGALLEAIQPFERANTAKSGIQVFDMSVPSDTTEFVHKSGCQHR